jgi:hypothetical protein
MRSSKAMEGSMNDIKDREVYLVAFSSQDRLNEKLSIFKDAILHAKSMSPATKISKRRQTWFSGSSFMVII